MPIHDWTRVDSGIFHDFHQSWTIELRNILNAGRLPDGYFALAEQVIGGPIPDVVTLQRNAAVPERSGGVALAEAPPQASDVVSAESDVYAAKANRIVIKNRLGTVVAVIGLVSPGNKQSSHAHRALVEKAGELLRNGVNLLVVDLFPPGTYDSLGIHNAIWSEIGDESFQPPIDKPLTGAAYRALEMKTAYVEPLAVGDQLPSLPIFLDSRTYIPAPLEASYCEAWSTCPSVVKELVE